MPRLRRSYAAAMNRKKSCRSQRRQQSHQQTLVREPFHRHCVNLAVDAAVDLDAPQRGQPIGVREVAAEIVRRNNEVSRRVANQVFDHAF
jgi:hypothetical protein